ncbi:MAG: ATP synthase F1 subunit epsilon [Candidatus Eremiobacteraeota bacterium]|nr:ATP synthase F1 subunit epsilon [Candidatus Eremiobacteraeota bacterium]
MPQNLFYCEIVSREKVKFKGDVEYLLLPGWEGEMGILKNHAPLVAMLRPGETRLRIDGSDTSLATGEGFVTVKKNKVLVVTSFALSREEIEVDEAEQQLSEERAFLKGCTTELSEFDEHRLRKMRAMACLKVAGVEIKE